MSKYNIGMQLEFGKLNWEIIDIDECSALIITKDLIDQRPYNNYSGDVTWEKCSLRKYLNSEFYYSFSKAEQLRIITTLNKNHDNQWYGTKGGIDTLDSIFLLSIEEVVCKYFGDSSKNLRNKSAKQRYWFQKKDKNNVNRRAALKSCSWWWWLRSPGQNSKRAAYIHGDGNVGIQGNGTYKYNSKTVHPLTNNNCGGIRPALWLDLSK